MAPGDPVGGGDKAPAVPSESDSVAERAMGGMLQSEGRLPYELVSREGDTEAQCKHKSLEQGPAWGDRKPRVLAWLEHSEAEGESPSPQDEPGDWARAVSLRAGGRCTEVAGF